MGQLPVKDREDVVIYRDPFAYISHPCITKLANGDYLVAFNESLRRKRILHPPSDPRFMNLVSRSRDGGQTWEMPRVVPGYEWTGVECPGIVQISTGEVLLVNPPNPVSAQIWALFVPLTALKLTNTDWELPFIHAAGLITSHGPHEYSGAIMLPALILS